jgi:O-antigen/teichoic acid export membrane protein
MLMFKSSAIYLFSSLFNKSLPLLFLPVITNYLSPNEYGFLSVFLVLITFYNAIIGMNVQINISKNYFTVAKDELSKIIGSSIMLVFIISLCFLFFSIIFSGILKHYTGIDSNWIIIIPILVFFMVFNVLNLTVLINERKPLKHAVFEVGHAITYMGLTILFMVVFEFNWLSQILGMLISYFLLFMIGLKDMKMNGYIDLEFDKARLKNIFKVSIPMVPHVLGGAILTLSDRLFIERMLDMDAVGIYSVGYSFGMVVLLFTNSFIKSWSPWFYKQLSAPSEEKKIKIVRYSYLYIAGVLGFAFILGIFGVFILPYFVNNRYEGASEFIIWVALGYAMFGIYQIFFPYLIVLNKTSFLAFSTTITTVINLILNYFLISWYGAIGAAYATFLSYLIMCVLVFSFTQKHYPMPWLNFRSNQ